ncbi:MAG: patatin-like phospholipase family protein [Rubrivivax sp.]|nr:patatin-like phospholipase family protein [Rubrivivax sp.]
MHETPLTGLILSGGGARAAYQVGVLQALCALRREGQPAARNNPFGVICGTSAGALNAAALACHADAFDDAVAMIGEVWRGFSAEQVYRADAIGVLRSGAQWLSMLSLGWVLARWRKLRPRSLLDNTPLEGLLHRLVPLERLPQMLSQRHLQALAVSASSYTSGEHVTFFESAASAPSYARSQRIAVPSRLTIAHLLASSAIPFVFPAQRLVQGAQTGWYGDGSMRQTAPISPAIHLGAQRVLIIGVGRMQEPAGRVVRDGGYPTIAQIGGHAMSSIFLDGLSVDVERLQRINRTLDLLTPEQRLATPLMPVQALVIAPSQRIDDIAARHQQQLPRPVRALLRGVGSSSTAGDMRGAAFASYLLFEAPFTRELMALGEADTRARRGEVLAFFGWH